MDLSARRYCEVGTGVSFSPGVSCGYVLCGVGGAEWRYGCFGVQGTIDRLVFGGVQSIVGSYVQHWEIGGSIERQIFVRKRIDRRWSLVCPVPSLISIYLSGPCRGIQKHRGARKARSAPLAADIVSKNTIQSTESEGFFSTRYIERSEICERSLRPFGSLGIFDEV